MHRIESSVTSLSWIPREAVEGISKLAFRLGISHYDLPPPAVLQDLQQLLDNDAIRFANELKAWIEVDDGRIVGHGQTGRGRIGRTTLRITPRGIALVFPAVPFPDLELEPQVGDSSVRFVRTAGGRPGMPTPRHVRHKPYVQVAGPTVWTTIALTIAADGSSDCELVGASSFPRHWVYDSEGRLAAKSGLIDYDHWYYGAFGEHSPWGREDSPVVVSAAESALERELSRMIIGSNPQFRRLKQGETLVEQGDPGGELFLLFDGVLRVEQDGEPITEVGPGALLGEMALLEGRCAYGYPAGRHGVSSGGGPGRPYGQEPSVGGRAESPALTLGLGGFKTRPHALA
jgi:hypothetical protein